MAACTMPSEITGRISRATNPPKSSLGTDQPLAGTHLSRTANQATRRMAARKLGMAMPIWLSTVMATPSHLRARLAAHTPRGMLNPKAMTMAHPTKMIDTWSRSNTRGEISAPDVSDMPRLPVTRPCTQVTYCCHRGLSIPMVADSFATDSSVAVTPRATSAGLPGMTRSAMKITRLATSKVSK